MCKYDYKAAYLVLLLLLIETKLKERTGVFLYQNMPLIVFSIVIFTEYQEGNIVSAEWQTN